MCALAFACKWSGQSQAKGCRFREKNFASTLRGEQALLGAEKCRKSAHSLRLHFSENFQFLVAVPPNCQNPSLKGASKGTRRGELHAFFASALRAEQVFNRHATAEQQSSSKVQSLEFIAQSMSMPISVGSAPSNGVKTGACSLHSWRNALSLPSRITFISICDECLFVGV